MSMMSTGWSAFFEAIDIVDLKSCMVQQLGEKITQVAASVLESSYISIESDQFALKHLIE